MPFSGGLWSGIGLTVPVPVPTEVPPGPVFIPVSAGGTGTGPGTHDIEISGGTTPVTSETGQTPGNCWGERSSEFQLLFVTNVRGM